MQNKNNHPAYYISEAAETVYANIPDMLKQKYDPCKIRFLLELEDDYYDIIGLNVYEGQENSIPEEPIIVDEKQLCKYIIKRAAENNLVVEEKELLEILHAELIYLQKIGAIGDKNI